MKIGPHWTPAGGLPEVPPDAVKPGFHCVRTHWIRGFMPFHRIRRTGTAMLMVPV